MKKIIGISGSYRTGSYNLAILKFIKEKYDDDVKFEIFDITSLPFFNEDLEDNIPDDVALLKNKIKEADGIVIATPEYNYSIPGILKNAIDWTSRDDNVWQNKLISVISASISFVGGARAQVDLKKLLNMLNAIVVNKPEIYVSNASDKIDNESNIIDEYTKRLITKFFDSFLSKL